MNLTICSKCLIEYPEDLVKPLTLETADIEVCGICALQVANILYDKQLTRFDIPVAERARRAALRWRDRTGQTPAAEAGTGGSPHVN